MRSEWVPWAASVLVIGVMALVLAILLNPAVGDQSASDALRVVAGNSGRWLAMSVLFFAASVALTLGLPAILALFDRRGRRLGLLAVTVFSIGTIGMSGYGMLLVFFRALVLNGAVEGKLLDQVISDNGLSSFLFGWLGCFYGGVVLIALALLWARSTPVWVPCVMLAFVALLPVVSSLGTVGQALQMLALAVAFTGIAVAATTPDSRDQVPGSTLAKAR